jgi:hypothetical protein
MLHLSPAKFVPLGQEEPVMLFLTRENIGCDNAQEEFCSNGKNRLQKAV